ncbi:MAG: hypothetical protein BWY50_00295 [Spirochaetes bacterium ADurb.Bin315]|nr:MAG: hypothetical protein BWY50_00295 [Spirochaetes bacterium ADurb.Bin315]
MLGSPARQPILLLNRNEMLVEIFKLLQCLPKRFKLDIERLAINVPCFLHNCFINLGKVPFLQFKVVSKTLVLLHPAKERFGDLPALDLITLIPCSPFSLGKSKLLLGFIKRSLITFKRLFRRLGLLQPIQKALRFTRRVITKRGLAKRFKGLDPLIE